MDDKRRLYKIIGISFLVCYIICTTIFTTLWLRSNRNDIQNNRETVVGVGEQQRKIIENNRIIGAEIGASSRLTEETRRELENTIHTIEGLRKEVREARTIVERNRDIYKEIRKEKQ